MRTRCGGLKFLIFKIRPVRTTALKLGKCFSTALYIVVLARWGLQQTTLGSGQPQDTGSGILTTYKNLKKKRTVHLTRFLLRQGEPGTSQYSLLSISRDPKIEIRCTHARTNWHPNNAFFQGLSPNFTMKNFNMSLWTPHRKAL